MPDIKEEQYAWVMGLYRDGANDALDTLIEAIDSACSESDINSISLDDLKVIIARFKDDHINKQEES